MSATWSLVCHETRQTVWVGQGWGSMTTFYSGEELTMDQLKRFLNETAGKPLVLLCDDANADLLESYEEFE